jgi:drug/metabolite transporter (DMT)-like permease
MDLISLLMIIGSACIHVVAHVGMKRARDRTAFMWWTLLWASILFFPVVLLGGQRISAAGWRWIVLSSVFEATYFISISRAYRGGDLSVVYPLARGSAPVFLLLWSTILLRENLTSGGIAGIVLIAAGLYVINLPKMGAWREPLRALRSASPRWALFAGLSTSLYTAVDKVGIREVPPLLYTYVAISVAVVWVTLWTLADVGWKGMAGEFGLSGWVTIVSGFTTLAAYAIVLFAMQRGAPAGYAGAVREISVILGAALGVVVFKESSGPLRLVGASLVAIGVALIGILG